MPQRRASHAALWSACHDVCSHAVPVTLVGECSNADRVERRAPVVILSELQAGALTVHPTATCPMPVQESSHVRSAQRVPSYEGMEPPANPTADRRRRPGMVTG